MNNNIIEHYYDIAKIVCHQYDTYFSLSEYFHKVIVILNE